MTNRHWSTTLLFPLTVLLLSGTSQDPGTVRQPAVNGEELKALTRRSSFVFQGTIEKLRASTLSIPTESGTAVVRIDDIIESTPNLRSFRGKQVTVRLLRPEQEREQTTRIFFTEPYSFGRTIGVTENGSLPVSAANGLRETLVKTHQELADDALAERLRLAQSVVVARVVRISPAPEFEKGRGVEDSEHDPIWRVAVLAVTKTLKNERTTTASVRFAASRDVMWYGTPKLKPEQEGIFLLQRNVMKEFPTDGPIVIDPLDVQDKSQQARIERLLAAQR